MIFLTVDEVCEIIKCGRSTLYCYIKDNDFPQPIKLGTKKSVWAEEEVHEWQKLMLEKRNTLADLNEQTS